MATSLVAAACDGTSVDEGFGPSDVADRETTMASDTTASPEATVAPELELIAP